MTGLGPDSVNPALRFGAHVGGKLGAIDDLKRSRTNRAAVVRTPTNLPTSGHSAAIFRFAKKHAQSFPSVANAKGWQ